MRKNRTKHEAKKPRLAKRALALCFALIFVCSCLLPAFANSEAGALADPLTMVEQQQDEKLTNDPVLLNEDDTKPTEGGTDSTGNDTNPTEGGTDSAVDNTNPTGNDTKPTEEPKVEEQPKTEGATEESKDTTGETKPEEPKTEETKPEEQPKTEGTTEESKDSTEEPKTEEPKQPTTNTTGDTINQGEATYTYRFWPDKIDALDLEAINDAVKKGESLNDAAKTQVGMVPCTVLTVMTNAHLSDYSVTEPTKDGYEFKGWYTIENGTNYDFSLDQNVNDIEESKTIDVFAKWNELKAVKSDALSNGGVTVEAKVGPMANVKSVALAEPNQSDAEKLRNSIDKQLYDQSYMVTIFDITPKDKDGMDVEPQNGESVNVEISGLDFSAGDNVWVYHLTNSGRVETLSATVTSDGGVAFTTKSFSPFAVVKLTEDVSSFGTEDDRLATADLYVGNSYNMKVGDTETLYGNGRYYGNHKWGSSDSNVVTVTGNDYFATVEAKRPGKAIVTHTYGSSSTHVERVTITVEEDTTPYSVYVYAKMSDTVKKQLEEAGGEALSINAHGWFTLGKVDGVTGLGNPKEDGAGQNGKSKYRSGWKYEKATGSLNDIKRYSKNAEVDLKDVKWDHDSVKTVTFGLTTADGATDYTGNGTYTWHLDGYIESLSAVVVNYYIDRDGDLTPIRKSSKTHLGSPGRTYTLTEEENLKTIPYEGRMYKLTRMEPTTGTQPFPASGEVATINLYYGLEASTDDMTKDTPYINVEKRFTGITKKQIPSDFAIHIGGQTLTKSGLNSATVTTEGDAIVLRWKLDGVDVGTHKITEDGTTVPGYKLGDVTGIGDSVEVQAKTYTVTQIKWIQSCRNSDFTVPVKEESGRNDFMVISTAGSRTNIILSANKLSASQRAAVAKYLKDKAPGVFKNNTANEFYSIKDSTKFTIAGAQVTYDKAAGVVSIGAPDQWNQVLELSCATDEGQNPEVQIVNPYTPATLDIQITKQVNSGDTTKDFKFKVTGDNLGNQDKRTLTDENGNKLDRIEGFTMKNGKTVTLHNVEAGMKVNVAEFDTYRYDVTATNYSTPAVANSKGEKTFNYEVVLDKASGQLVLKTEGGVTVENNHIYVYNTPATTSLTVTKAATKDGVDDTTTEFNFTLTLGNKSENVTWSKNGKTDTVAGASYEFKLKGGESITFSGISVEDDSVKVEETNYSAQHYTTTVDGRTGHDVTISAATLKQNQNTGTKVEFTNAYTTPKLESMTITKSVTGAFGERTKAFNFSVTLTHEKPALLKDVTADGVVTSKDRLVDFTMMHGKQVTLGNIPIDTTITITEWNADDYKTSATGHKNSIKNSGARTFTYKVVEEGGKVVLKSLGEDSEGFTGNAITVTNNFDGTPDTGVLLDTLPYLILLAVAVAGGVLVVVRKRKHRDE